MIDTAIEALSPLVGLRRACQAVGRPRASHYRAHPVSPGHRRRRTANGRRASSSRGR